MTIPNQLQNDFIKHTIVDYTTNTGTYHRLNFYDKFGVRNGNININFNFLAKEAAEYSIVFTFILASSKSITRALRFKVEVADNLNINMYKIHAKDDSKRLTKDDFIDNTYAKYMFKIQPGYNKQYYSQYMPYMLPTNDNYKDYNGIKLTRTVVVDLQNKNGLGHLMSD